MNEKPTSIDWFKPGDQPWFMAPFFRWSLGIIGACLLGILAFEWLDFPVFKLSGWAHSYCYLRDGRMIALHVTSDSLIGAAYISISSTLAYIVYKASKDIPFNWVFLAFGLFIVSCGFTHFMEVWVVWQPVYWLSGYVKVITAAASLATAIALFPLVPKIFLLIESAKKAEQRREEVERLNEDLEQFNYSVAHDLRAPLRGIIGFSTILQEDLGTQLPAEGLTHLASIDRSARRMMLLLEDLLRYSSISRQHLELRPIDSGATLTQALGALSTEIEKTHAKIVSVQQMPVVIGSETLLMQVFQNLLENALKFRAPGRVPEISISATRLDKLRIRFEIADNGIGIPSEHAAKVFGLFERLHANVPGTGIGLPLVKRAIERMNGEIGFESPNTNGGATFWFVLRQG